MKKSESFLKPGSQVLVTVSGSWLGSRINKSLLGLLFMGNDDALQHPATAEVGISLLGVLRQNDAFPGLVLKLTGFQGNKVSQTVELYIPWAHVETVITHEKWSQKDFEKQIGFAVSRASTPAPDKD
jgi:hypothetical protein